MTRNESTSSTPSPRLSPDLLVGTFYPFSKLQEVGPRCSYKGVSSLDPSQKGEDLQKNTHTILPFPLLLVS